MKLDVKLNQGGLLVDASARIEEGCLIVTPVAKGGTTDWYITSALKGDIVGCDTEPGWLAMVEDIDREHGLVWCSADLYGGKVHVHRFHEFLDAQWRLADGKEVLHFCEVAARCGFRFDGHQGKFVEVAQP